MAIWLLLIACFGQDEPLAPRQNIPPLQGQTVIPAAAPQSGVGTFDNPPPQELQEASSAGCRGCDIYLVSICSLRKDHVGAYGMEPVDTPHMDALARDSFVFERAYAASNFTLAGLTSILTGRFPSSSGVTGWDKGLTSGLPTLPEVLSLYGYRTAAFTTDAPSGFRPEYGLDRGFQHMSIYHPPHGTPDGRWNPLGTQKHPLGETAEPLVEWLEKQPLDQPVFAMLHSRTAHFPFVIDESGIEGDKTGITKLLWEAGLPGTWESDGRDAMPGMAGGERGQGVVKLKGPDPLQVRIDQVGDAGTEVWKQRYREAVHRADADLGVVMRAIEKRGRMDRSIVVLVADHGESLNDHGELLHGDGYFEGVVNVPLLIKVPGLKPGMPEKALVSQVDIMPSLLELAGAVEPAGIDGISVVSLLRNEAEGVRAAAFSEGGVARHDADSLPGAVIAPPWALLSQRRGCGGRAPVAGAGLPRCLYNLIEDPGQLDNLASERPDVVRTLLALWDSQRSRNASAGEPLRLTPAYIDELRRSGYDFQKGAP
jgi:arylsulfatase A-like enzyme